MSTCFDVAKYILEKKELLPAIKLQKLIYYSQAWSLVWDDSPLFLNRIEAWINGPVVVDLYEMHKGKYSISCEDVSEGDAKQLSENQKDTINHVLEYYGDKSSKWLSDLTHLEDPWKNARKGLLPQYRGNNEISHAAMAEYYSSIFSAEDN
jgi:uncharacterized phage-associated protein